MITSILWAFLLLIIAAIAFGVYAALNPQITLTRKGLPDVILRGRILDDGNILLNSRVPEGEYLTVSVGNETAPFPGWYFNRGDDFRPGIYAPNWTAFEEV